MPLTWACEESDRCSTVANDVVTRFDAARVARLRAERARDEEDRDGGDARDGETGGEAAAHQPFPVGLAAAAEHPAGRQRLARLAARP